MAEAAPAHPDGLAGRDAELAVVDAFLGEAEPPASILLLEGEAGIGKTTLWRAAVGEARARGYRTLTCAASGSETQLSFTALHDLIDGAFDEVAKDLPPPQRRALAVTLMREEPVGSPPERTAIAVAALNVIRALAERGPLLLAVDDAQWLDPASAFPLAYTLRRLRDEPVRTLLTRRPEGEDVLVLDSVDPAQLRRLSLEGLAVGALGRIFATVLGTTYARPTLQRLRAASRGNPLLALELARALGPGPSPLPSGAALPVPKTFLELVRPRLRTLEPPTLELLALASALSRPTVAMVGAAVREDPLPLITPAVEAQIVDVVDGRLQFAHPLFASAVYELIPQGQRAAFHGRLAEVVDDPEERARHLALATSIPDEAVAQVLEEAAASAYSRARPAAAAELAAHARRLTPTDRPVESGRRGIAQIDFLFSAGETEAAAGLLEELLRSAEPGQSRARLLSRRARVAHFGDDIGKSVELLRRALVEAGDDAELRADVEEALAWGLLLTRKDLPAAEAHARSAVELNTRRRDDAALAEALAAQALLALVRGGEWRATMTKALALEEATLHLAVLRHPTFALGYCLSCADEHDKARAAFTELQRRALEQGDESSLPSILNHLTLIETLAGRWDVAISCAEEGYDRALESGQQPTQTSILAKRALIAVRRGALDEARELAWRALAPVGGRDFDLSSPEEAMARGGETAIWALGSAALADDDAEEAHQFLGPMTQALLAAGIEEPGEVRCLPDEIDALIALGRLEEAGTLAARLDGWARRLERSSVLAAASRCQGRLLAAQGKDGDAIELLDLASAWSEQAAQPFERGQALLALGTQQRRGRQRRKARDTLETALAIFEELGAEVAAANVRAELGRIGGRAPSGDELTESERRIAELVAEGKTNKEVAAILVVADRTVESALTQIYRKLQVRSRVELTRKLQQEP